MKIKKEKLRSEISILRKTLENEKKRRKREKKIKSMKVLFTAAALS